MPSLHLDMEFFTRSQKTLQKKKVIKTVTLIQRDTSVSYHRSKNERANHDDATRFLFSCFCITSIITDHTLSSSCILKKKILTIKIKVVCCGKAGAVGKIIV